MLLLVDNRDSFTFNLVQALEVLGAEVHVARSDAASAAELVALRPDAVVIGPGPGRPAQAGCTPELFGALPLDVPLLGVCLGLQGLVEHAGGALELDRAPIHGRASLVHHDCAALFRGLPNPFAAGRYHSIRAARAALPDALRVTAWTDDGEVMAVEQRGAPRHAVQFHPESILTPEGGRLLANFLELAAAAR